MDAAATPMVTIEHPTISGRTSSVPRCSLRAWERVGWHEQGMRPVRRPPRQPTVVPAEPAPEPATPEPTPGTDTDAPTSESES